MDVIANVRECFRKCLATNWVITRLFRLSKFAFMKSKARGCSVFLPSCKVSCIRFNAN